MKAGRTLEGSRVLVTGGGGSIGSELVKQIASQDPASLVVVDHDEYRLYEIVQWCKETGAIDCTPMVADIRHQWVMDKVFADALPEYVFHAAALKHVPMLELEHNVIEAIRTNVVGTKQVLDLARKHKARDFVMVSTDKAVNPLSVMGMTKRAAEKFCLRELDWTGTRISVVRFGNVIGSSGSVIPLFERQIANGGPVTVTHPDMDRFFMTIQEAVHLMLNARQMSEATGLGGLYMLDMGPARKIVDVAKELIERSGKQIEIVFTGVRPGEKLSEELSYGAEEMYVTAVPGISKARRPYENPVDDALLWALMDRAEERDSEQVKKLIRRIVPEYAGDLKV